MSFIENLFRKKKKERSGIVIDVGTTEVAGAYVQYTKNTLPVVLYLRSFPIDVRTDEPREHALMRALDQLGNDLIRKGAPLLARATGKGSAESILVSVDAPWQETSVRREQFESGEPFLFTKSLIEKSLEEHPLTSSSDRLRVDESIVGTILNGYETRNPYGQEARRASVIVLSSCIDRLVQNGITATFRGLFHTPAIQILAGSSLRYQAMRTLFPHENDVCILDATSGSLVSIVLVRNGTFVTLIEVPVISSEALSRTTAITNALSDLAKQHSLPRTILLLGRDEDTLSLRKELDAPNFRSLWPSTSPPAIVSVLKNHFTASVRQTATHLADTAILLMALYAHGAYQEFYSE